MDGDPIRQQQQQSSSHHHHPQQQQQQRHKSTRIHRLHIPISNKQTHRLAHNGDKLQQQQLTNGHCSEICKCAVHHRHNQQQTMRDKSTPRYRLFVCDVRWVTPLLNLGSVSIGAHRETQTTHSRQIALCLLQSSTKSQTESNRAR